jgi:hypothetical protein
MVLERAKGSQWFSTMDLAHGYHQLQLPPAARPLVAFSTPLGVFSWTVVPQGLKQAPAWFSRTVDIVLSDLKAAKLVSNYLDDVITHTAKEDQHLVTLERMFQAMRQRNLYAKLEKCIFFAKKVDFLGHNVTSDGVTPQTSKIDALLKWPEPVDSKGKIDFTSMWRFYGLCNWFRKHFWSFSEISNPIVNLLHSKPYGEWTPECSEAFKELKRQLEQ